MHTQEYIRSRICYSPDTGEAIWNRVGADDPYMTPAGVKLFNTRWAGRSCLSYRNTPSGRFRYSIIMSGSQQTASRVIWVYMTGREPDEKLFFLNQDQLDTRWSNICTESEYRSIRHPERHSRDGMPWGIMFADHRRKKYVARARNPDFKAGGAKKERYIELGGFSTLDEALEAQSRVMDV